MKFEYYPEDIANSICDYIKETDPKKIDGTIEALVHLQAICENEYNHEYFRDFYKVLEALTDKLGVYIPF